MSFEPKIVGFLCNWCSYAGADLAGISRKKYTPNVRVVRVMCSGRVDPTFVLKAFEAGADGVIVLVCPEERCRYLEGSIRAKKRVAWVQNLLDEIGLDGRRLSLANVAAGDLDAANQTMDTVLKNLVEVGPNPAV